MTRSRALLVAAVPVISISILNGIYLNWLSPALIIGIDVVFMVVIPWISFAILSRKYYFSLKDIGIFSYGSLIGDTLVCAVISLGASWLLPRLTWALLWRFDWITSTGTGAFSYSQIFPVEPLFHALAIIYLSVSGGVIEEVYFRGLLRYLWVSRFGKSRHQLGFIMISALLFGLAHWEGGLTKIVWTFLWGVIAARLLIWAGNLWPLIIAHVLTDLVYL